MGIKVPERRPRHNPAINSWHRSTSGSGRVVASSSSKRLARFQAKADQRGAKSPVAQLQERANAASRPNSVLQRAWGNPFEEGFYLETSADAEDRDGTFTDQTTREQVGYRWVKEARDEQRYVSSERKTGWKLRNLYRDTQPKAPEKAEATEKGGDPVPEVPALTRAMESEGSPPPSPRTKPESPRRAEVSAPGEAEKFEESKLPEPAPVEKPQAELPPDPLDTKVIDPQLSGEKSPETVAPLRPDSPVASEGGPGAEAMGAQMPETKAPVKKKYRKPPGKKSRTKSRPEPEPEKADPTWESPDNLEKALAVSAEKLAAALKEANADYISHEFKTSNFSHPDNVVAARAEGQKLSALHDEVTRIADAIEAESRRVDQLLAPESDAESDAEPSEEVFKRLTADSTSFASLLPQARKSEANLGDEVAEFRGEVEEKVDRIEGAKAADAELTGLRRLWTTPAKARGHFLKHTGDTGYATEREYHRAARDLVTTPGGTSTHRKVRANGDQVFFNAANGHFSATVGVGGAIKTLFRPGAGINYYNSQ
ncbi:MAG: hypothetical protein AAF998_28915 [Bacteroidota bacterium]